VSIENVIHNIQTTRNFLIVITIGGFLVFSFVTYGFTSVILHKMSIIINSMRKVQEGYLDVDIPIYGFDEIAELAYCFRNMLGKIKDLISTVVRKELIAKETELKALHSQINAHFLYNVLETIKMMSELDGNYDTADALTSLGKLMRYSMSWKKDRVFLSEELDYIDNYMKLLNIRYDINISYTVNIPEDLQGCVVCKMSIQPIVENAVVHGIQPKGQDGMIKITGWEEEGCVVVEIFDNGKGIEQNALEQLKYAMSVESEQDGSNEQLHAGIGLRNVNERLKLAYGKQYGIEIESIEGVFTKVRLKFPYIKNIYHK
jgi:two-component system sensor histidine kinase YesM